MRIDLTHNKIINDAATTRFLKSIEENLLPMLSARYDGITAVMMYEDYLSCDLRREGTWYYPITVVTNGETKQVWVTWQVDDVLFRDAIPYAYLGESDLTFAFAEEGKTLSEMKEKVKGKAVFCEEDLLRLEILNPQKNPFFLTGKYSQTFVDEINRRMTAKIGRACGVRGLAESGIVLLLPFAMNTFMEHTGENVTYRRFQLSAKGCAPRDFWVKWTRKNASSAFSITDDVSEEEVEIEFGEDVPQKIREKEFRYLAMTDPEKYASSTSKKNVTEWRDLIRRALKRGDLQKAEEPVTENAVLYSDIDRALNDLLMNHQPDKASAKTACESSAPEQKANEPTDFLLPEEFADFSEPKDEAIPETESGTLEVVENIERGDCEKQNAENRIRAEIEKQLRDEYEHRLLREREALQMDNARRMEAAKLAYAQKAAEEEKMRIALEERAKADARERERLTEAARLAIAERDRLAKIKAEQDRIKAEEMRAEQERREAEEKKAREAEERKKAAERYAAERERIKIRAEEARVSAEQAARLRSGYVKKASDAVEKPQIPAEAPSADVPKVAPREEKMQYTYTSHVVYLYFRHPVDGQITARIREIIGTTLEFFHKDHVFMKIQATVQDPQTVILNFQKYPEQESELLVNIIKVLGNSKLGVAKITLD